MATGDAEPQKPRLPSFVHFLSGASRGSLDFAPQSPAPNRGDRSLAAHATAFHQAAQPDLYAVPPAGNPAPFPGPAVQLHGLRLEQNQTPYWPHPTLPLPESRATFPSVPPSLTTPASTYNRKVVGEEAISGNVQSYMYDDGGACQKTVDGDNVNPKWGTTKAGKPRKRLGQACNTCREKKIKCDPSTPKCAQCQKFGRECKFDSMPRAGTRQGETGSGSSTYSPSRYSPSELPQEAPLQRKGSTASTDWPPQESHSARAARRTSMPLESLLSPASEDAVADDNKSEHLPPAKRARVTASPRTVSEAEGPATESLPGSMISPTVMSNFSWQADPIAVESGLILYYVGKYFSHVEGATYCTLPRKAFVRWVQECESKSVADAMLLHAMSAMGTVFSKRPDSNTHRALFTQLADEAAINTADHFSLQSLQTRRILALLAFSQGQYDRGWDLYGSAVRTAFGLKYNTEAGVRAVRGNRPMAFWLDYDTLVECRRRTLWSVYIIDCFNGCCATSVAAVPRSQCHIRLPCGQYAYESGRIPLAPFELDVSDGTGDVSQVGLLGYLVEIATILHDTVDQANCLSLDSTDTYNQDVDKFYHATMSRLYRWDSQLRRHLRKPRKGDEKSEPVSGLHILYHYTAILLHRYVRHAGLDQKAINLRITGAFHHAQLMLEAVQRLSNGEEQDDPLFRFATTSPFSGFAITTALDVVTASGTFSDLTGNNSQMMSLMSSGIEAVESLVIYWHSAARQCEMIRRRLSILLAAATRRASDTSGAFYFGEPMESAFTRVQDIIYGIERLRYFQALGWAVKIDHEGDFHRLDPEVTANSVCLTKETGMDNEV
ncbi:hypothetical protein LTR06_008287 [Exophiala xenobiotica]|nr:hypothetical protein LTR06_008287 [Exophiala xenobiotica]